MEDNPFRLPNTKSRMYCAVRATILGALTGLLIGGGALWFSCTPTVKFTEGPIFFLPLCPATGAAIGLAVWRVLRV